MPFIDRLPAPWRRALADPVRRERLLVTALAVVGVLALRNRHDYSSYQTQWRYALAGTPYAADADGNAYGPVHQAFALLFWVHRKLPRLVFTLAAVAATFAVADAARASPDLPAPARARLRWLLLLSPLLWVFVVVFGNNEGLLASLTVFGVLALAAERPLSAAALLAVATLQKFTPLFLVPFLAVARGRIRWRFGLLYAGLVVAGMGVAWALWGAAAFSPIAFAAGRSSRLLSIFSFLAGPWSPLHLVGVRDADAFAMPLLLAGLVLAAAAHLVRGFDAVTGALLGLAVALLTYKVGNHQFHLSMTLLLPWFLARRWVHIARLHPPLLRAAWWYLGWIAFCTALYAVTEGYWGRFAFIRDVIGLPTFAVVLALVVALLRYADAEAAARRTEAAAAPGAP